MARAGYKPVIEICGGTEIGGGFLAGSMLQPQCPSTFSTPSIGEQSTSLHLFHTPITWPCHGRRAYFRVPAFVDNQFPLAKDHCMERCMTSDGAGMHLEWRGLSWRLLQLGHEHSSLLFAGANFVLLTASGEQSAHGDERPLAGELAIVPPLLGSSQRLLNRDHHSVYYKVLWADHTSLV
jgi:hypothetical protein